jgi:hypothetical protein
MKESFMLFKNMKSSAGHVLFWCIAPLFLGFITPLLISFYLEVFVAHNAPTASITSIIKEQFADGIFLFIFFTMIELIPFAALSVTCFIIAHKFSPARLACFGMGGLFGILGFMIPAHISVLYPHYSGGHMSSTSGLAFLFIPFCCIITLGVGLLIGWCVSLLPCFHSKITV